MSHVLLFGGPTLKPIIDVLEGVVAQDTDWWIGVLTSDVAESLIYRDAGESLSKLASRLDSGQLASVQLRRDKPHLMLIGVYQPKFCDQPPNQWQCILEGKRSEATNLYFTCLDVDGLAFVSLSVDEAPEFTADDVSIDTFPWDDWRLVRASVRSPNREWEERSGRA